nr:retention module-containing protein [uncultured Desulfobacter sp.]
MAQAGVIKTITGDVNARTPDGQVRQLMAGDMVYENEMIETSADSELTIELNDGRTLDLAGNSQVVLDETVVATVAPQDAVVAEVQELQAALEAGDDIPDEETAAGEEDAGHDYNLAYYAGDQSGGEVDSYLFGTTYGDEAVDFPAIEGEQDPEAAPEPNPVFIVGSSDDDEGSFGTEHTVNPYEGGQGEILGQAGADILVGDPGSITPVSNNYILVLDFSDSMTNEPDDTDLDKLRSAEINSTIALINDIKTSVENAVDGYKVKINLLPFAKSADAEENSAWISFENVNGTVVIEEGINSTDQYEGIMDWIQNYTTSADYLENVGWTNYFAAFSEAYSLIDSDNYAQNNVIFISDGSDNGKMLYRNGVDLYVNPDYGDPYSDYNTAYEQAYNALNGEDVESIRAVGIDMSSDRAANRMEGIDTTDEGAISIQSGQLYNEMYDLMIPQEIDYSLDPAGNDVIYGNDGNDLIFGDVLNTDGLLNVITNSESDYYNEDYDLSTIVDLPPGSGWEVFEKLEEANLDLWTREDTIRYIKDPDNHKNLVKETVLDDGDVRDGGDDYIYGGAGDDIIYGQEGDDTIDAGSGDDVVDGGSGFDTLAVTSETELDFSNVSNIESIDLNEDGVDQTVTLSLDQVLSMTDEDNILQITGESGDSVTLTGVDSGDWTHDGNGLFTNVADNSIQITIEAVNDGVDIDVDVDNGDSFQV